jgi:hypothetical protein
MTHSSFVVASLILVLRHRTPTPVPCAQSVIHEPNREWGAPDANRVCDKRQAGGKNDFRIRFVFSNYRRDERENRGSCTAIDKN